MSRLGLRRGPRPAREHEGPAPMFTSRQTPQTAHVEFSDPTDIGVGLRQRARSTEPCPPPQGTAPGFRPYSTSMSVHYATPRSVPPTPPAEAPAARGGHGLPPPTLAGRAPAASRFGSGTVALVLLLAALGAAYYHDPCLFPFYDRIDPDALDLYGSGWKSKCDFVRDVTAYRKLMHQVLVHEYAESLDRSTGLEWHVLKERADRLSYTNGWPKLTYRPAHNRAEQALELNMKYRVMTTLKDSGETVVRLRRAPSIFSLDVLRVYDWESTQLLLGSAVLGFLQWSAVVTVVGGAAALVLWRGGVWYQKRVFAQKVLAAAKDVLGREMKRMAELHAHLARRLGEEYTLTLHELEVLINNDPAIETCLGSLESDIEYLTLAA